MQPKIHIHYSPVPPGFVSALFYIEFDDDVYGWYALAEGHYFSAAFFMLENFYAERSAVLYRSVADDVYGPWVIDSTQADNEIRCPLPEPVRHELERIQSNFVEDWLFFENDPAAALELAAYDSQRLSIHAVNIKSRKLNRLEKSRTSWEHGASGIDLNVIDFLQKHWDANEKVSQRQYF
jgi:hypothetical protein